MANMVSNIGLARVGQLYRNVATNTPNDCIFLVILLASTGIESDEVLRDAPTLAQMVAGTTNESTNTGYARIPLNESAMLAFAPDNVNNQLLLDINDQTWLNVQNNGTGAIGDLIIAYDPDSNVVDDTAIIPLTIHDFVVTPDGSNITAQISSSGFFRAQPSP